ncbi:MULTISPECIES: precorrin-6y C5,15-methyltransferase (decarboxylating) subunit CbiE [Thermoanaerobacterium]|uniref:Precorrin-6y C5,15-methyltransferase subunit CbiE n=2 Tax=Thermoanaerobacterium TaxID=28895 RepID=W9ECT0_9THEO|nr:MULTISPECIES: precorrin-6y C5,15-methyltransferase (decarboxylating) subunit CbiE [Thermoanaerobacterium]AFK87639.1 precorrin-6y C5,15-methyltransferase (decarboxylating), CbiE subunit [Thermoanaerobacterium saccharolyticum JW/SL-YS485]ETO37574.1 precorrin-6y C5,15-methyltransferase subunit CbiE [Thermoanaerobacterium aotearoense SCUT27]
MVTIVGMGPGSKRFITNYALEKIRKANVLVGGKRHIEEFEDIECEKIIINASTDYSSILKKEGNIVILASGDPLLYGIAEVILKYVDKDKVEIIPGISSVQYMCAKLKITMNDLTIVSLHGRDDDLVKELKSKKKVAVFTDDKHTPQFIASSLKEQDFKDIKIYVGENLSYDMEKIYSFTVEELSNCNIKFDLNVVVITCGNT